MIYPNPTAKTVTIKGGSSIYWDLVRLENGLGHQFPINLSLIDETATILVGDIASGVYLLHLPTLNENLVKRILIN